MSNQTKGMLRNGWSSSVGDYPISGGWTSDGESFIVLDAAGSITVFNGKSGTINWSLDTMHGDGGLATAIHPSGRKFATAGQNGKIMIWNSGESSEGNTIVVGNAWVENLAWSPDGSYLAASSSKRIYVYDENGVAVWDTDNHRSTVATIAWSSQGELATACYGQVTFFDGLSGKINQRLEWKGSLVSMVLSTDGDIVACGSQDNTVHFWRRSTANDSQMSGYPFKPSALAFDQSGTYLATGGSETVTVWNFKGDGPEGTTPLILSHHREPITSLTFSSKGTNLASGARDGTIALWILGSGGDSKTVGSAKVVDTVGSLYWRPDGKALAALDRQGGVTVWRV